MVICTEARKRLLIAMVVALPLAVVTWFAAVDWSSFVETCPDCGFGKEICQYRILTIPISERTELHHTAVEFTASEMGIDCQHPRMERWHKYRFWGLSRFFANPRINGTMWLQYEGMGEDSKAAIREMVRRNPHLPEEYASRVLGQHDMEYLEEFWIQARAISVSTGN